METKEIIATILSIFYKTNKRVANKWFEIKIKNNNLTLIHSLCTLLNPQFSHFLHQPNSLWILAMACYMSLSPLLISTFTNSIMSDCSSSKNSPTEFVASGKVVGSLNPKIQSKLRLKEVGHGGESIRID